eukprot:TRINITY_DN23666_c0_g1_i1.p1 TRINITY_DN23666_c0_g1~~TRINITY_DN23666_c0_g1_i1.p1  ORF type:complete len:1792 (+),score=479.30 TRINITY_DN23666_c0_g1_i1:477-5378(+)
MAASSSQASAPCSSKSQPASQPVQRLDAEEEGDSSSASDVLGSDPSSDEEGEEQEEQEEAEELEEPDKGVGDSEDERAEKSEKAPPPGHAAYMAVRQANKKNPLFNFRFKPADGSAPIPGQVTLKSAGGDPDKARRLAMQMYVRLSEGSSKEEVEAFKRRRLERWDRQLRGLVSQQRASKQPMDSQQPVQGSRDLASEAPQRAPSLSQKLAELLQLRDFKECCNDFVAQVEPQDAGSLRRLLEQEFSAAAQKHDRLQARMHERGMEFTCQPSLFEAIGAALGVPRKELAIFGSRARQQVEFAREDKPDDVSIDDHLLNMLCGMLNVKAEVFGESEAEDRTIEPESPKASLPTLRLCYDAGQWGSCGISLAILELEQVRGHWPELLEGLAEAEEEEPEEPRAASAEASAAVQRRHAQLFRAALQARLQAPANSPGSVSSNTSVSASSSSKPRRRAESEKIQRELLELLQHGRSGGSSSSSSSTSRSTVTNAATFAQQLAVLSQQLQVEKQTAANASVLKELRLLVDGHESQEWWRSALVQQAGTLKDALRNLLVTQHSSIHDDVRNFWAFLRTACAPCQRRTQLIQTPCGEACQTAGRERKDPAAADVAFTPCQYCNERVAKGREETHRLVCKELNRIVQELQRSPDLWHWIERQPGHYRTPKELRVGKAALSLAWSRRHQQSGSLLGLESPAEFRNAAAKLETLAERLEGKGAKAQQKAEKRQQKEDKKAKKTEKRARKEDKKHKKELKRREREQQGCTESPIDLTTAEESTTLPIDYRALGAIYSIRPDVMRLNVQLKFDGSNVVLNGAKEELLQAERMIREKEHEFIQEVTPGSVTVEVPSTPPGIHLIGSIFGVGGANIKSFRAQFGVTVVLDDVKQEFSITGGIARVEKAATALRAYCSAYALHEETFVLTEAAVKLFRRNRSGNHASERLQELEAELLRDFGDKKPEWTPADWRAFEATISLRLYDGGALHVWGTKLHVQAAMGTITARSAASVMQQLQVPRHLRAVLLDPAGGTTPLRKLEQQLNVVVELSGRDNWDIPVEVKIYGFEDLSAAVSKILDFAAQNARQHVLVPAEMKSSQYRRLEELLLPGVKLLHCREPDKVLLAGPEKDLDAIVAVINEEVKIWETEQAELAAERTRWKEEKEAEQRRRHEAQEERRRQREEDARRWRQTVSVPLAKANLAPASFPACVEPPPPPPPPSVSPMPLPGVLSIQDATPSLPVPVLLLPPPPPPPPNAARPPPPPPPPNAVLPPPPPPNAAPPPPPPLSAAPPPPPPLSAAPPPPPPSAAPSTPPALKMEQSPAAAPVEADLAVPVHSKTEQQRDKSRSRSRRPVSPQRSPRRPSSPKCAPRRPVSPQRSPRRPSSPKRPPRRVSPRRPSRQSPRRHSFRRRSPRRRSPRRQSPRRRSSKQPPPWQRRDRSPRRRQLRGSRSRSRQNVAAALRELELQGFGRRRSRSWSAEKLGRSPDGKGEDKEREEVTGPPTPPSHMAAEIPSVPAARGKSSGAPPAVPPAAVLPRPSVAAPSGAPPAVPPAAVLPRPSVAAPSGAPPAVPPAAVLPRPSVAAPSGLPRPSAKQSPGLPRPVPKSGPAPVPKSGLLKGAPAAALGTDVREKKPLPRPLPRPPAAADK